MRKVVFPVLYSVLTALSWLSESCALASDEAPDFVLEHQSANFLEDLRPYISYYQEQSGLNISQILSGKFSGNFSKIRQKQN